MKKSKGLLVAAIFGLLSVVACTSETKEKETVIIEKDAPEPEKEEGLDFSVSSDEKGDVDVKVDGSIKSDK